MKELLACETVNADKEVILVKLEFTIFTVS